MRGVTKSPEERLENLRKRLEKGELTDDERQEFEILSRLAALCGGLEIEAPQAASAYCAQV